MAKPKGTVELESKFVKVQVRPNDPQRNEVPRRESRIYFKEQAKPNARFKEFTGAEPWVMVSDFRVKIDGCVGESFIRSYAFLTRSTDVSEAIVAWYGVTKHI